VRVFGFPNPVNEVSARLVAAGVVGLSAAFLATGWNWLVLPLAYGFVARVAAGPRFSPLGRLVTEVVTPRLGVEPKLVPGPPKRFAQGIGAALSLTAAVLAFGFGAVGAAQMVVGMIAVAATLEAALGFCLGCKLFALGMRVGLVPETVCEACNDLSRRLGSSPSSPVTA
jgi:hypothetical protein